MTEKSNLADNSYPNDIYDRMFKRLLTLSAKAIIRFINGIFGTDYPENSSLRYNWTEFENEKLKKILADTIVTINDRDAVHFEVQMTEESIVLRVLEYGFAHALRTATEIPNPDTGVMSYDVHYPRQTVIYLDSTGNVPDEQIVRIHFGDEGVFEHHIPVIHFQEKTVKEIKEQSMVILLPFRLLRLRRSLQRKRSPEKIMKLLDLYNNDIIKTIEQAYLAGEITDRDRGALLAATRQLMEHLYKRYSEVWEVIKDMRDHSIQLDIDEYLDALEEKDEELARKNEELEQINEELERKDEIIQMLSEKLAHFEQQTD